MFLIPELKKLLKTKSIILYLPPNGTQGESVNKLLNQSQLS